MNKSFRHAQILNLVRTEKVRTQDALAEALRKVGIETTQATLSRDIAELGLLKTPQGYVTTEAIAPQGPDLETVVQEFLQDVRVAQHTLVLKTAAGSAGPLAEALDQANWPEVVGTIAGDNAVNASEHGSALTIAGTTSGVESNWPTPPTSQRTCIPSGLANNTCTVGSVAGIGADIIGAKAGAAPAGARPNCRVISTVTSVPRSASSASIRRLAERRSVPSRRAATAPSGATASGAQTWRPRRSMQGARGSSLLT